MDEKIGNNFSPELWVKEYNNCAYDGCSQYQRVCRCGDLLLKFFCKPCIAIYYQQYQCDTLNQVYCRYEESVDEKIFEKYSGLAIKATNPLEILQENDGRDN